MIVPLGTGQLLVQKEKKISRIQKSRVEFPPATSASEKLGCSLSIVVQDIKKVPVLNRQSKPETKKSLPATKLELLVKATLRLFMNRAAITEYATKYPKAAVFLQNL